MNAKCCLYRPEAREESLRVLVQIGGVIEMFLIDMDTLSIEQDSIPDGERSGVLKRESGEIELTLANAMHQLDA